MQFCHGWKVLKLNSESAASNASNKSRKHDNLVENKPNIKVHESQEPAFHGIASGVLTEKTPIDPHVAP